MNRQDFFTALTYDCSNDEERALKILRARGFLIDITRNGYYLNDNSHPEDYLYLRRIFEHNHFGKVTKIENRLVSYTYDAVSRSSHTVYHPHIAKIEITKDIVIDRVIEQFDKTPQISFGSCFEHKKWSEFAFRLWGKKVPVSELEPYIAFMVKALSSCGVWTNFSCDGNHPHGRKVIVNCHYPFKIWGQILLEQIPSDIKVRSLFHGISFTDDKFDVYYDLYRAAEYLYRNRWDFRDIKKQASTFLKKSYCRTHSDKEIEAEFTRNCRKLFNERTLK